METPESIRTSLQEGECVTSIDLKDTFFPYTCTSKSTPQKIPEVLCAGSVLPVQKTTFWSVLCSDGIHNNSQGSQTDSSEQRYKNPPVPGRLVGQGHVSPNLSPAYPDLGSSVPGFRLGSKHGEIRAGTDTDLQFHRLPLLPQTGQSQTYLVTVASPKLDSSRASQHTFMFGQTAHVTHMPVNR